MSIKTSHPLYAEFRDDWILCRDSYRGERVVKRRGTVYLPATPGQIADGMQNSESIGYKSYEAYKTRASFPDFMSDAVETMIGLMWNKPPVIELPAQLEPLRENATNRREGLMQLLRRINEQQLVTGRIGMLVDLPTEASVDNLPYIATYQTEAIVNWDDGARGEVDRDKLMLVVLDESEYVRTQLEWNLVEKYRVLVLDPETGAYKFGVLSDMSAGFNPTLLNEVLVLGKSSDEIPFVFVNSKDLVAEPDDPPLVGLARLCMTIYRGEADYRQSLFLQGQDTLVVSGGREEDNYRVGAGAAIMLPTDGKAEFIGVNSSGLPEQRQALENDKMQASNRAAQLVDTRSREKESGDALRTRVGAQTATLNQIALTGAAGLENVLKIIARWVGANEDEVKVQPNLDFVSNVMAGKELLDLTKAKAMGAPISNRTIHELAARHELTSKTFEEELDEIMSEEPLVGGTSAGGEPGDAGNGGQSEG